MEKNCEFCGGLRPVVYCKADSACLCLSCDSKVHSANALSQRHFRALLCEVCGNCQASVQCLDHRLFMCHNCDGKLHDETTAEHQKRVMNSYMGCPSARDFAVLWGYDLNQLRSNGSKDLVTSASFRSVVPGMADLDISKEISPWIGKSSSNSELGLCNLQSKIFCENEHRQDTHFVLQQILDLERLEFTERNDQSSIIHGQVKTDIYSSKSHTSGKLGVDFNQNYWHPQDLDVDLRQGGSRHQELQQQHFPSPFSQLEHLNSSLAGGVPFDGDPFLHCKSPVQSSQMWSQNIQDLGICEEIGFHDAIKIPDVDLTFQNYEELFSGDQDQSRSLFYIGGASTSMEKDALLDKLDEGHTGVFEDKSVAAPVCITQSCYGYGEIGPSDQAYNFTGCTDSLHPIRPAYSSLSFSFSRLSAETNVSDYLDSGISPNVIKGEPPWNSPDMENTHFGARGNAMRRYKEKKKARVYDKQIRYASHKATADLRKRMKGRFVKAEGYESNAIDVTRSY